MCSRDGLWNTLLVNLVACNSSRDSSFPVFTQDDKPAAGALRTGWTYCPARRTATSPCQRLPSVWNSKGPGAPDGWWGDTYDRVFLTVVTPIFWGRCHLCPRIPDLWPWFSTKLLLSYLMFPDITVCIHLCWCTLVAATVFFGMYHDIYYLYCLDYAHKTVEHLCNSDPPWFLRIGVCSSARKHERVKSHETNDVCQTQEPYGSVEERRIFTVQDPVVLTVSGSLRILRGWSHMAGNFGAKIPWFITIFPTKNWRSTILRQPHGIMCFFFVTVYPCISHCIPIMICSTMRRGRQDPWGVFGALWMGGTCRWEQISKKTPCKDDRRWWNCSL